MLTVLDMWILEPHQQLLKKLLEIQVIGLLLDQKWKIRVGVCV